MKLIYAIFYTKDIERVKQFYLQLGFKIDSEETGKFISFQFENDVILGIKLSDKEREVPGSQTIILSIDDIENHFERMKSEGYNIYKELSVQAWGKNFSILDPDGNKIEFMEI